MHENSIILHSKVNRIKNRHVKPWFLCTDEECATEPNDNPKNKNKIINKNCSNKHVENRFIQMNEHLSGPFASPATYEHFKDFQNIQMNLIATNICPLLDDAVEMYRIWPGNKTIHVFDSLPHGFIQFIDLSPSCKKASKQIVQIINSAIEDNCNKLTQQYDTNNNETNEPIDEIDDKNIKNIKNIKKEDEIKKEDKIEKEDEIEKDENLNIVNDTKIVERL